MNTFEFLHNEIKKKMGFTCYFIPDSELDLIKKQVNKGLMSPVHAEKRITRFRDRKSLTTKGLRIAPCPRGVSP